MLIAMPRSRGFTLIELMIGIVVLGILIALATPVYSGWNANTQVRNLAESIQNGLRLAQAEAAKRNARVDLVLTNDNLATNPTNASPTAAATGTSWVVRVNTPAAFVQASSGKAGSANAAVACGGTCPTGFDGTVGFTGLGRTTLAGPLQLDITNSQGGTRALRVVVSTGGKVRMCDPAYAAGDPRACS